MTWTDDDVRDEMDEQEEDQFWIDSKGKIVESAFCAYFPAALLRQRQSNRRQRQQRRLLATADFDFGEGS